MADPIIPSGIRVLLVLAGTSGAPEDRYVTTWAFNTGDGAPAEDADLDAAMDQVEEFVNTPATGVTTTPGGYIGSHVDTLQTELRAYRLSQTPPREPMLRTFNFTNGSSKLPAELAVCLSYYATRNLPRQRGRIYWGPLATAASDATTADDARPTTGVLGALRAHAIRMASEPPGGRPVWSVLSQADGDLKKITAGWVDNAFDIQRRRGVAASSRSVWP